jgi:enolase
MSNESRIVSVTSRQIYSAREHPGVETTVVTECGAKGTAIATGGISVGAYEAQNIYDGGDKWHGAGVSKAISNVVDIIGPAIVGKDASQQLEIDNLMIELDGTPNKAKLGGNAIGSVSAAIMRASAACLGIPLYKRINQIFGEGDADVMPVPSITTVMGGRRYGGDERGGTKPTYALICYGFNNYSDAVYAGWETQKEYFKLLWNKHKIENWHGCAMMPPGTIEHDRVLWELMVEAIANKGYEGKLGLQVDVAANGYYDKDKDAFVGIFSAEDKTRDDLIELYREMVDKYSFIVLEDPLDEIDYEGHALLTRELGIQIVGDDLFSTNVGRLKEGIEAGAGNAMVLKVFQMGTISEAFEATRLAHKHGYRVLPCNSRGEGDSIGDYAVGLVTGQIREEDSVGPVTNRLLEIEAELGNRARFLGKAALKLGK